MRSISSIHTALPAREPGSHAAPSGDFRLAFVLALAAWAPILTPLATI